VWNLIAVLALAVGVPQHVAATKLDGTVVKGQLEAWSADGIVLTDGKKTNTLPTADLLALEFSGEPTGDTGGPLVELVDGSALPMADFISNGQAAEVRVRLPADGAAKPLSVPIKKVNAVRLQAIAAEVLPQWQEIRELGAPSDVVVVSKRGGKSLDHLECVLGEVTEKEVAFELDGEQMRVPRAKVAGLIYYRADKVPAVPAPYIVAGPAGMRLAATNVRWQEDGTLTADTLAGVPVSWPVSGIFSVDLSAGKVRFLSDIEPAAMSWQPLVGLPKETPRAAKFGQVRFNRSSTGGPLTLAFPHTDPAAGSSLIKTFNKGLAIRSRTQLVYRLPSGFDRFLAEAGIEPGTAASGNVVLMIYGDDRVLFEHPIDGADAPVAIDLPVSGVKRLQIVVDYGENLDTGDWLNLCNARVVK
jgi:hypothetical protein